MCQVRRQNMVLEILLQKRVKTQQETLLPRFVYL